MNQRGSTLVLSLVGAAILIITIVALLSQFDFTKKQIKILDLKSRSTIVIDNVASVVSAMSALELSQFISGNVLAFGGSTYNVNQAPWLTNFESPPAISNIRFSVKLFDNVTQIYLCKTTTNEIRACTLKCNGDGTPVAACNATSNICVAPVIPGCIDFDKIIKQVQVKMDSSLVVDGFFGIKLNRNY